MRRSRIDIGILTVIPAELEATLQVLGLTDDDRIKSEDGTNYWFGSVQSGLAKRSYELILGIIGGAGNNDTAAATVSMIKEYSPKIIFLVGIAAGIKRKIKIGEVVLSERVVAYEPAAIEKGKNVPRPEMTRIPHSVEQDVASYFPQAAALTASFTEVGGSFPSPPIGSEKAFSEFVAKSITARRATVASGEKLLKDPRFLKTLRRTIHGKIELGEMEAAGLAAACRRTNTPWLVVRGISDFGDSFKSDEFHPFAAKAAAVVLSDFIKGGLQLDFGKGLTPSAGTDAFPHLDSLKHQLSRLINPAAVGAPSFDVRLSVASSYDDLLSGRFTAMNLTPSEVEESFKERRLLIHSAGGTGKTAVMARIAEAAIGNGKIVFFLDLKTGSSSATLPDNFTIDNLFDLFSVDGNVGDFRRALTVASEVLLMIDGLNEVSGPMSKAILSQTEKLLLDHPILTAIVADRMNPRTDYRFVRGTVVPLSGTEIQRVLPAGTTIPSNDAERQLLATPFFLDLQLSLWESLDSRATPQSVLARREMFMSYFTDSAKLGESELNSLAAGAFSAYEKYQGRTFENDWWRSINPTNVCDRLDEAGITIETVTSVGERKRMFRHQLIHDFLTGYYVANLGRKGWTSDVFDAATFKTNSAEPISFAAELLNEKADEFLIQVYDWSYRIADRCIGDLQRFLVHSPVSRDLEIALLVKNAEKKFDVFEYTSNASDSSLNETALLEALELKRAESIDDVLKFVENFSPSTEPFQEWKQLFLLRPNTVISEEQLLWLDWGPIIGWTAANTFRRIQLTEENLVRVRMMYHIALKNDQGTLRWRIVHLLGRYPSDENVALLQHVIINDKYDWARYGAIRSLMEIATLSDQNIRTKVISELRRALPTIKSALVIREIRRTCLVVAAAPTWYQAIRDLAVEASRLPEAEAERDAWVELLDEINRRAML
jgi:nucleoside phosphorylase